MSAILSKILMIIIGFCVVIIAIPCIVCLFASQVIEEATISPEDVFIASVNDTIPESVEIIDYQANLIGIDSSYWIHFSIDPKDLDNVMEEGAYDYDFQEIESLQLTGLSNSSPAWWKAKNFSEEGTSYQCSVNGKDYFCYMWVNDKKSEVYFLYGTI